MQDQTTETPAQPDTAYIGGESARLLADAENARARAAVQGAVAAGVPAACVPAYVVAGLDSRLRQAQCQLWSAVRLLHDAGLGRTALHADVQAAAEHADALLAKLAVQLYA